MPGVLGFKQELLVVFLSISLSFFSIKPPVLERTRPKAGPPTQSSIDQVSPHLKNTGYLTFPSYMLGKDRRARARPPSSPGGGWKHLNSDLASLWALRRTGSEKARKDWRRKQMEDQGLQR